MTTLNTDDDDYADTNDDDDDHDYAEANNNHDDDDDGTTSYAPPPGSLRPNELSDVEEKAHYPPIATFFGLKFQNSSALQQFLDVTLLFQPFLDLLFENVHSK